MFISSKVIFFASSFRGTIDECENEGSLFMSCTNNRTGSNNRLKTALERSCRTGFKKTRRNYHREESKQPGTVIRLRSTGHLQIHTYTHMRLREFVVAASSCIVKLHFPRRAMQLHYVSYAMEN